MKDFPIVENHCWFVSFCNF